MLVYRELIKYFKDHLLETLRKKRTPVGKADIHWVLPVPAMWTESERQFMRKAAYQVSIGKPTHTFVRTHRFYIHNE